MIDWAALGQVVAYSFAAAVTVTLLFTSGVVLASGRAPALRLAVAGVAFAASLALVVLGLYVMFTTK
jgi:hypothetical protein